MTKRITLYLATASLLLGLSAPVWAGSVSFTFTKPENTTDTTVSIVVKKSNGTQVDKVDATITPGMTAAQKRDAIKAALEAKSYTVTSTGGTTNPGITIHALTDGRKVYFRPGSTGEKKDGETSSMATFSSLGFEGTYNSTDWEGDIATFTAGVTTSLGEVTVEYIASDVPPGDEIDGTYIAQRLFNDLLVPASDLGAQLVLEGHEIQIYFDAGGNNGVIFGTTSPGDGLYGGGEVGINGDGDPTDPLPTDDTAG
jgi:hypothetical protein